LYIFHLRNFVEGAAWIVPTKMYIIQQTNFTIKEVILYDFDVQDYKIALVKLNPVGLQESAFILLCRFNGNILTRRLMKNVIIPFTNISLTANIAFNPYCNSFYWIIWMIQKYLSKTSSTRYRHIFYIIIIIIIYPCIFLFYCAIYKLIFFIIN